MSRKRLIADAFRDMSKLIDAFSRGISRSQVFADFAELAAIAVANNMARSIGAPPEAYEKRENRYLHVINQYERDDRFRFPELLGLATLALERTEDDVLGRLAMECNSLSRQLGQSFTPFHVSEMMAKIILQPDQVRATIAEQGYITICEPCCGAGGMVLAAAKVLRDEGFDLTKHVHFTAVDISPLCVHMTYLQTSLKQIPTVIYRGNSLTMEFDEQPWFTPAHVRGRWYARLDGQKSVQWASLAIPERLALVLKAGIDTSVVLDDQVPAELQVAAE